MLCLNGKPVLNKTADSAPTAELKPDFSIYSINLIVHLSKECSQTKT